MDIINRSVREGMEATKIHDGPYGFCGCQLGKLTMKNDCKCYQIRNDNFNNYTDEEEQQKNENNFRQQHIFSRLKFEMPCAVFEHTSLIQIYDIQFDVSSCIRLQIC